MVNPADVLIKSSEMLRKSDAVDRCKQAWSLQGNKLKGIYTPDSISLVMCSLIRLKNSITKDTTRQKNRIKSQLRYLVIEMTWKFLEPFSNWLKPFIVWLKGGGDAHSERSLGPRHPSVRVCRTDPTSSARGALRRHPYPLSPCYNTTLHRARSPILYSQPLLSLFCEVENLHTQGFQFPRALFQCGDLMRDCNVGEVRIDDLYNLIIVVGEFLKLEIKIVQPGDELRLRRIASDDNELLGEDSFDDKTAAVMLRSGFTKQLLEANILLFIEPERVLITRSFRLPGISVCLFTIGIHNIGSKGVRLGRTPGLAEQGPLSDKCQFVGQRYSSLLSGDNKNPRRRISDQSFENPPLRLPEPGRFPVQYYNRFGVSRPEKGLQ